MVGKFWANDLTLKGLTKSKLESLEEVAIDFCRKKNCAFSHPDTIAHLNLIEVNTG